MEKTQNHLIAGFLGGLTSAVALQPFDLLKTRLQQDRRATLFKTIKELSSLRELWRGTLPSAIRTSVGSAMYLTTLNTMRSYLAGVNHTVSGTSSLPKLSMYQNLLSGAATRAMVGWITMPITVLKVRYESTKYQYTSMGHALRSIYANDGARGFFYGFGPTVLRDAPYAGLYVLFYEQAKVMIPQGTYTNSAAAFSSAVIATTITSPFDTIKTRMQLEPLKYTGFLQTLGHIVKKESIKNLFDGLSLRLTRKAFSAGIAWGIYEELVKLM